MIDRNIILKRQLPVLVLLMMINLMMTGAVYTIYLRYIIRAYGFIGPYSTLVVYYRAPGMDEVAYEDAVYPEEGQFYHDLIETGIIDPSEFIFIDGNHYMYRYERNHPNKGIAQVRKGSAYDAIYSEDTEWIDGNRYTMERCTEWVETNPGIIFPVENTPNTLTGLYYLDDMTEEEHETVIRYFTERGYVTDDVQTRYFTDADLRYDAVSRGYGFLAVRVLISGLIALFLSVLFLHRLSLNEYRIHFDYGGTSLTIALHKLCGFLPVILISETVIPAASLFFNGKDIAMKGQNYPLSLSFITIVASLIIICGSFLILFPWDQVKEHV